MMSEDDYNEEDDSEDSGGENDDSEGSFEDED